MYAQKYFNGAIIQTTNTEQIPFIQKTHELLFNFFNSNMEENDITLNYISLVKAFQSVSPFLRNELFLLLIIRTKSTIKKLRIKAWQCFAVVSCFVSAEPTFFFYLLNFIYSAHECEHESDAIRAYSEYTFVCFMKNRNMGNRSVHCTEE